MRPNVILIALAAAVVLTGPAATATSTAATTPMCGTMTGHPATYKHVIVIMMENHSYTQLIGQSDAPFINHVAASCGSATNYHNVTHLSWANYIAITNGQNPTCIGCKVAGPSIFTQAGSWSGYAESMANPCAYTGTTIYARRHNPATYYTALLPTCRQRDVNLGGSGSGALYNALSNGTLANYTMITPNLCDDMHNCSVATGDSWLRSWIASITSSQLYRSGQVVVFVTWGRGLGSERLDPEGRRELRHQHVGPQLPGRPAGPQSLHHAGATGRDHVQPLRPAEDQRAAAGTAPAGPRAGRLDHLDARRVRNLEPNATRPLPAPARRAAPTAPHPW